MADEETPIYWCPVCSLELPVPPKDFYICPQCGTEFENDDYEVTHAELREKWIAGGSKWWFTDDPAYQAGLAAGDASGYARGLADAAAQVTARPGPAPAAGEPRLTASERAAQVMDDAELIWPGLPERIAAAIAEAERAAARAQMERDCREMCPMCNQDRPLKELDTIWFHLMPDGTLCACTSRLMRRAFAAAEPRAKVAARGR